ncbi:unnamed protein product [Linum trigynum]|uniref:F-box domain-containing protein n=1 Tax=Linum trigynum TaxID=586398 RepID=A0AAV2DQ99_9ROSI
MPRAPAKGGRQRGVVKGSSPDRLSDLPDEFLHCILSFLDTKAAVRSGILSSRWKSLWRTVPVLNFDGESFNNDEQSFKRHVDRFLYLRSTTLHEVRRVSVLNCPGFDERSDVFTALFLSISRCGRSLETLNLKAVRLYPMAFAGPSPVFKVLTTLTLVDCCLDFSCWNQQVLPFAGFPMLQNLKLISCSCCLDDDDDDPDADEKCLKVSGPQLLCLEIHAPFGFDEIEVSAPKLESFTYRDVIRDFSPITQVSLNAPSLQHANIMMWGYMGLDDEYVKEVANQQYSDLLLCLSSVETLSLQFETLEVLINACDLVKNQPSPFARLKSVRLLYSEGAVGIPPYVMHFFRDGSPFMDENAVKLTKVTTSSFPYNLRA